MLLLRVDFNGLLLETPGFFFPALGDHGMGVETLIVPDPDNSERKSPLQVDHVLGLWLVAVNGALGRVIGFKHICVLFSLVYYLKVC